MSEEKEETIEEIEERRAKKQALRTDAEKKQYRIDLLARDALEDEHGKIAAVRVAFTSGQPTCAFVRTPTPAQYKRFVDQVGRATEKKNIASQREATELLAKSCWVYPEPGAQESMLEAFPGLLSSIGVCAARLAEGKAEEEGKG
jgi:ribosomal protein L35AE/L33A